MPEWAEIYKLQYERIAQHENQRLAFSSLVVAITTGALAFISAETKPISNPIQFFLLTSLLVLINVTAVQFISKSRSWVKHHQTRARAILIKFSPETYQVIETIKKTNSDQDQFRRPNLQRNIHLIIIAITLISALNFSWPYIKPLICSALSGQLSY